MSQFIMIRKHFKQMMKGKFSLKFFRMIAKLVVWGQDRNQALNSLIFRLSEYHVNRITNTKMNNYLISYIS